MSAVALIHRHMNGGAGAGGNAALDAVFLQKRRVAHIDHPISGECAHTTAGDLLDLQSSHNAAVNPAGCLTQSDGNRMAGITLRRGRNGQQLLLAHARRKDVCHGIAALGDGAGLVKDHRLGLCQRLKTVFAFGEYTHLRGEYEPFPIGQRNAESVQQRPGQNQQNCAAPQLLGPFAPKGRDQYRDHQKEAQHAQHPKDVESARGVLLPGGETLRILRNVHHIADRGLFKAPGDPHFDVAGQIHASGIDPVALVHRPGGALPGDGRGVHRGDSLHDGSVQGNPFPGTDKDHIARHQFLRPNARDSVIRNQIG